MKIQEIDTRDIDDPSVDALAELKSISQAELFPDDPPVPPAEIADQCRRRPNFLTMRRWLAWSEDDRLLGSAMLELEFRNDNRHLAWVEIDVMPEERRAGLGSELLARAANQAARQDRSVMMSATPVGFPGAAFAAASGFTVGQIEHQNRLAVADIDRSLMKAWLARAAEDRAAGYSLLVWDEGPPDDLIQPYVKLLECMNDAPRGDLDLEDFNLTADEFRDLERSRATRGITNWTLVARRDSDGALAGLTELLFLPHRPWIAQQGDTGVDPTHRNRGLGRWLKAANILRLLDERPQVTVVETYNAGSNDAMLSINHAMGFRRTYAFEELQADITLVQKRLAGRFRDR